MSEPVVFLNGEFMPASQAKIAIYDFGIVMGATFAEMTRTFGHRPFRAAEHLARFYRSLKYGGIAIPLGPEEMLAKTLELIATNVRLLPPGADLGIVHFATPGEQRAYAGSAVGLGPAHPTVCIHSFPLPFQSWRHYFAEGAHAVTPAIRHVPPQCVDPKTKNRSRMHWWLADQQTHAVDPKAVTLLLDLDGNITETGGANFVLIQGRTIYSPTSRNIMHGISLQTVIELAPQLGLQFVQKNLQPYDAINADEAWLTTTPYCIAPCTRINCIPIGDGKPGPLFRDMQRAWSARVGLDIERQLQGGE
jgi:branched-chain amino acid aminotransferase